MKEEKGKLGPRTQSQPHGPELLSPLEQSINKRKHEGKKRKVSQAHTNQENMPKKKRNGNQRPPGPPQSPKEPKR